MLRLFYFLLTFSFLMNSFSFFPPSPFPPGGHLFPIFCPTAFAFFIIPFQPGVAVFTHTMKSNIALTDARNTNQFYSARNTNLSQKYFAKYQDKSRIFACQPAVRPVISIIQSKIVVASNKAGWFRSIKSKQLLPAVRPETWVNSKQIVAASCKAGDLGKFKELLFCMPVSCKAGDSGKFKANLCCPHIRSETGKLKANCYCCQL